MVFFRSFLILSLLVVTLSACGSIREDLGLGRAPPDEFAVIDRAPLAMPPDFGLRPPVPGAPRPQEVDPSIHANDALFGSSEKPVEASSKLSSAEKALLEQTGADKATPDIRTTINNESSQVIESDPHLLDKLLWWKKEGQPGTSVDASAEAARIKEAKEKGEPLNKTATPIIEKQKSGWLGL